MRETGRARLVELIIEKIGRGGTIDRVPRSSAEEALLLNTRPDGWEYLLFAAVLLRERDALDTAWRDHRIRYSPAGGPVLEDDQAEAMLKTVFREAAAITTNVAPLASPETLESAFGKPGEPGDPEVITHVAERFVDVYRRLLGGQVGSEPPLSPSATRGRSSSPLHTSTAQSARSENGLTSRRTH